MEYIEAPTNYEIGLFGNSKSLFLAGGISNCRDWQRDLSNLLVAEDLVLLNPRRANFPMHDPSAAMEQIVWEYQHMRRADAISFWFSSETINPIVLYELGAHSMTDKTLFVGVERGYVRRSDVEIQTQLVRPDVKIVYGLEDLSMQVKDWARG